MKMRFVLLNSPILTTTGEYLYSPISLNEVRLINAESGIESFIGHQSTADILSSLINDDICVNREMFTQKLGDVAIIFKLKSRPPEGVILTVEEIEKIGYSFFCLEKSLETVTDNYLYRDFINLKFVKSIAISNLNNSVYYTTFDNENFKFSFESYLEALAEYDSVTKLFSKLKTVKNGEFLDGSGLETYYYNVNSDPDSY